ncbi:4Fe-4S binding protein [bacterium]|nr:4Fe-4S binding protein [bacterium]
MKKQDIFREIAANLGIKGEITVPEGLWGYGQITYDEAKCIGCGLCEENCPEEATKFERVFDLVEVFKKEIPPNELKKNVILNLIKELALKEPEKPIEIPDLVLGYGRVVIDKEKCIGCGNCERYCSGNALKVERLIEIE